MIQQPPSLTASVSLPLDAQPIDLLGISYTRIKTADGGDLYLTKFGLPFWEHLQPENWYAQEWFEANRERLVGTSLVYRLPTKQVRGRSLDLVTKWSRVGEDVPVDTMTICKFINADFNSPFEEFSLLNELRAGEVGPPGIRLRTQKPLAIYVPSKRLQLWQTGRSESKIAAKLARHPGIELDILRQYVLLYGWIKGLDIVELADEWQLQGEARERFLSSVLSLANHEMEQKGYRVIDMKPAHIIVRQNPKGDVLRDRHGQMAYALVDYELLERTPIHEQAVRLAHRQHYLQHMARRFERPADKPLPPHLKATTVLGADYIFSHAESTGGKLWVVGKDPDLVNYFLPERWRRTPKESLSSTHDVFYTRTKDNIHLVWRVSRMGDAPPTDAPRAYEMQQHGYNSPFEEFAYALDMSGRGVRTVYPRAIYMTGRTGSAVRAIADLSRYKALEGVLTPDGRPALGTDREYITIWGFWNGPDELLAVRDGQYYVGINADQAFREGRIGEQALEELIERVRRRLRLCGYEHLNLKPDHLLVSFGPDNKLVLDTFGKPQLRLCNFEMIRRIARPLPA